MWPFTNRLREATSYTTKLQSCQSLEISNLEIFFWDQHLPPRPNSPMRPPPENFIFDLDPYKQFCGKTWIYLSGSSIGWMLIQSDSRLYIRRGQGSGSPGEEGTGEGRKRESRGREDGYIWGLEAGAEIKKTIVSIVCWDPLNKKMNRKMNKNVKFWHSLRVEPGFLILLINLKGHKSTGGGRTCYGKRETLVPPCSPLPPPPPLYRINKEETFFFLKRKWCQKP